MFIQEVNYEQNLVELKEHLQNELPLKDVIDILNYQYPGEFLKKLLLFFYCIGSLINTHNLERVKSNHQTIIIIGSNPELRTKFVHSVLDLFPQDLI